MRKYQIRCPGHVLLAFNRDTGRLESRLIIFVHDPVIKLSSHTPEGYTETEIWSPVCATGDRIFAPRRESRLLPRRSGHEVSVQARKTHRAFFFPAPQAADRPASIPALKPKQKPPCVAIPIAGATRQALGLRRMCSSNGAAIQCQIAPTRPFKRQ